MSKATKVVEEIEGMEQPLNDGGPAFPIPGLAHNGMSLRDWFAGMAMQQICAGPGARMVADRDQRYNENNWAEIVASNAYNFADAMIAEREKARKQ